MKIAMFFQSLKDAWRKRDELSAEIKPDESVVDFLPAALEILEKPPSPIGKWVGYSLMILFTLAVAWAFFGKVDIVASAEGKLIPGGRVKLIQPLQMGVVKNIFVHEGERVAKGQALIELDQVLTGADMRRLSQELHYLNLNLIREKCFAKLLLMEEQGESVKPNNVEQISELLTGVKLAMEPIDLSDQDLARQAAMTRQKWLEYKSEQSIATSQILSAQAELSSVNAEIKKYRSTLPLIGKRVEALEILNKDGLIAEARLLELREEHVGQQQSLAVEIANLDKIRAAKQQVEYQAVAQRNIARKTNFENTETLLQQINSTNEELNKANELYAKQILASPVKGRVKQLVVHTIGGVVEQAQVLMQIVPEENFLEVEAVLQNKDIGFVSKGQKAEIKVHTFPFTKYGLVDAEVIDITADAIESEKQGLVYTVRLKVDQSQLWVDTRWVELLPGMAVTAEVKTSKRRLIEFFLSPLLRYKDESIRER